MSTLDNKTFKIMDQQIENAAGKNVSKEEVLRILHKKLIDLDEKNPFIVDQWEGAAVKELINEINRL